MFDIFTYPFFQRAVIGGLLIGGVAPLLGVFLVLRRLSMIGDTISHISVAGLALGYLLGIYPIWAGFIFALAGAFAIERLRSTYRSYAELSIAILMSAGVAVASLLLTMGQGDVSAYFFGSIYSLNAADLITILAVVFAAAAAFAVYRKEFFLLTFDEDAASVSGLPVRRLNFLLTVLTALVITAAIKVVGALLVSALITIPVACSLLISNSFWRTALWAVAFSEAAVLAGLSAAGVLNLAPAASIVLLLVLMLMVLLIWKRGLHT
jgi:zinc transport system permease protein